MIFLTTTSWPFSIAVPRRVSLGPPCDRGAFTNWRCSASRLSTSSGINQCALARTIAYRTDCLGSDGFGQPIRCGAAISIFNIIIFRYRVPCSKLEAPPSTLPSIGMSGECVWVSPRWRSLRVKMRCLALTFSDPYSAKGSSNALRSVSVKLSALLIWFTWPSH